MKFGPVNNLKRETRHRQKKRDNDATSESAEFIVIFPIYCQFGATRKLDSGCTVCKTNVSINSKLFLTKTVNRTKTSQT